MSDTAELAEVPVEESNAEVQPTEEYSFVGDEQEQKQEPVVESASTSEEKHEPKQDGVQKRFNKLTAEKYELKDQIAAQQKQIDEMMTAQVPAQPAPAAQPVQTALPDQDLQYDNPEEYARQLGEYNRQIAMSVYNEQQQAADVKRQQEQQVQQAKDLRASFIAKANELGVSEDEAFGSLQVLVNQGASENLSNAIGHHDKAPAIAAYLAKNPAVFEEINALSEYNPMGAAQKMLSIEAEAVTRNISEAPPPSTNLNGLSAREPDEFDKLCPGATFA